MVKRRLKQVMARATGKEQERVGGSEPTSEPPAEQKARTTPAAQKRTPSAEKGSQRGGRGQGGAQRKRRAARARKAELPAHYDSTAKAVIERVRPRTMTQPEKLYGLILATRYVAAHKVPGDIVECGVWRGGSMQAAALTLIECGDTQRDLHLYDTFEGMTPPEEVDRRRDGTAAAELLESSSRDSRIWAVATLEDAQAGMTEIGYPPEHVHFHPGRVEDTIPRDAPESVALLRLDTDWYASTRHELDHLYDRLSPGGVLIIDDYGYWEGSRRATEEFLAQSGARLLLLPSGDGRIAVKPG
jgi:O-methyltransferase